MARQDATGGFRGFSPVPQILEEIMDDLQLVPQRARSRPHRGTVADSSMSQIMEENVVVVRLVPQ